VLDCLSLLIVHSASSFLPFRPIPVFSLLVPTSESRHHFSLSCTLSSQILRNFLCFSSLFLACPCLCPFHSDKRKMDEFHLPFALVVFLSLFLSVLFLFSPTFRQYPTLFPSTHFVLKLAALFPAFLFLLHSLSSLCKPPLSNIFLARSLPHLIPSIPRSLPHLAIDIIVALCSSGKSTRSKSPQKSFPTSVGNFLEVMNPCVDASGQLSNALPNLCYYHI
jgi:hypothetical protein